MPEVKGNPDYQLVMKFLQLIKPGDMDEDSANQLMMIGQRIQNGGALSDKEREMFQSVVGAMPMQGEMDMSYTVDGQAVAMTPSEMQAARDSGEITPMMGAMTDAEMRMMQEEEFQRMIMQENEMKQRAMDQRMMGDINSGVRPPARPMTSSPRPMPRPMR
tara:strand:+ start:438 stop:920 length:483 start_codon:yes stop_codon:yes gene_type:complete